MTDQVALKQTNTLLIYAVLALLVWLPVPLGSVHNWSSMLFVSITAVLTLIWSFSLLVRSEKLPQPLIHAALPLFSLLLLTQCWVGFQLQSGLTQDSGASFRYLLLGCGYSLLFLLIIGLFNSRKRLTLLLTVLIISGTLQAFYGAFMHLSGSDWQLFSQYEGRAHANANGTFVNRNHFAGYLIMSLSCGIGLLLALRDGGKFNWHSVVELLVGPKARLRLAMVIMVIALVLSHSRMGNAAFFSSLIIIGSIFILNNKQHRLRNALILASIILIDLLVISQHFGLDTLQQRIASTRLTDKVVNGEIVQKANELRPDVFFSAVPLVTENLIKGTGAGSFEAVYQRYPGPMIRLNFDHAHNDYLQFQIEYGLIGFLPLCLCVLICFSYGLQALRHPHSWYRNGVGFGASMGILAILFHSTTDFNLQIPSNAATFVVLCAIAVLAKYHPSPRKNKLGSE